jgi:ankyrin repeat protein
MLSYLQDISVFNALFNELLYCASEEVVKKNYDINVINALREAIKQDGVHLHEVLKQRRWSTDLNAQITLPAQKAKNEKGEEVETHQTACLLHLAVLQKSPNAASYVSALIKAGAQVDSITSWGATSLCLAAEIGNVDIAKVLITNGANVNFESFDHYNSLHIAVINKKITFVEFLMKEVHQKRLESFYGSIHISRIDIDQKTSDDNAVTALHFAVRNNDIGLVRYLLSCGASDVDNAKVGSPLVVAIAMAHLDIVKLLIGCGFSIEKNLELKVNLAKFCSLESEIKISEEIEQIINDASTLDEQKMDFTQAIKYLSNTESAKSYLAARLMSEKFGVKILDLESTKKIAQDFTENQEQAMITFSVKMLADKPNEYKLFCSGFDNQKCIFDPLKSGPNIVPYYPGFDEKFVILGACGDEDFSPYK